MQLKTSNENLTSLSIRKTSRKIVLGCIRDKILIPRSEIAVITGLTEAAISRITRELIDAGMLREVSKCPAPTKKKAGRPLICIELNPEGAFTLGLNISAISQSITLVDLRGFVLRKKELSLTSMADPIAVLKAAAKEARQMITESRIPESRIVGVGVAIAGIVDTTNSVLIQAPNLGWSNIPVADILNKQLKVPIFVSSRPAAILVAERRHGIAKGKRNVALFLASLGIGGAIMMNETLISGQNHSAGQIGHLPVGPGNEICTCGRNDCLDTRASGHSVLTRLNLIPKRGTKSGHGPADAKLLLGVKDKAAAGHPSARKSLYRSGNQLGRALRGIAVVLDPELIIIAGTLTQSSDYRDGVFKGFSNFNGVPLAASEISEDTAGAWLALDVFVFSENLDFSHLQNS